MTWSAADTGALLRLARAGDDDARGRLLEACRPYLTLLAQAQIGRRLAGKADPADVVQETFLEAHRDFAAFRGDTPDELLAWLRQTLVRNLADLVRRYYGTRARDPRLEVDLAADVDRSSLALANALAAPHSTPSERAERAEQAVRLADALARLPADYRDVLVLRCLEGRPFREVAARLGRSVDSVEKVWVRALEKLRQVLPPDGPPA
jgi:RNA polymerase sigma-70 factor, ECF subfamily